MNDIVRGCYLAALGAIDATEPKPLYPRAKFEADERRSATDVSLAALYSYLAAADLNDELRKKLHVAVSRWDIADTAAAWTQGTAVRTSERRTRIYECLGISDTPNLVPLCDRLFPLQSDTAVVISDTFEPWYSSDRRRKHAFYWPAYSKLLVDQRGWNVEAMSALDDATNQVVERLTDPFREEARQAKGLVVGYVQSGKTANFTGVIAKAIDAGYRLIIVLTGTIDVLREQTQRRVDMELVGKDNILRNVDVSDPELVQEVDYQDDPDWDSKFLSFGFMPSSHNYPDIIRLTRHHFDYRQLKAGIMALEFEKADKTKPLYAEENLPTSLARLAIVKKNKEVLKKLVKDLKSIKTPRHEIPVLIIDDESDQASVNTSDPKKWAVRSRPADNERTAINKSISQLLKLLPRAQYVGYTATPFANVFVDPSDVDDIFPKDFLISLERPRGYMGVRDFHDIGNELEPAQRTVANSNEKAYVRDLRDGADWTEKLQHAVDAFVLSGALKLYRAENDKIGFRHHTMLVHASVKQTDHAELATAIRDIWKDSGYGNPSGLTRLRRLFEDDFGPVSRARAGSFSFPADFESLKPYIAQAIAKITSLQDPVIVVNGDKDMASEDVDFDKREVWRILVGGTKLSRGFTVEGLTVSYYRRKTKQADTLMQMGRWFGFRRGYSDLVRLYIGRAEPDTREPVDLYEAFEAIVRDEEAFRDELRQYAQMVDGRPQITPKDIPPLVSQHLPWLKPAARNKMFNAELVIRRTPGSMVIPTAYPLPGDSEDKTFNYNAVAPLMATASNRVRLIVPPLENLTPSHFDAFIGEAPAELVINSISAIRWSSPDYYAPDKSYLREIAHKVPRWVIIAPQTEETQNIRSLPGIGDRIVFKRGLKPTAFKQWGEPTDRKHRPAAQLLAGCPLPYTDPALQPYLHSPAGAVLIYPMAPKPNELQSPVAPKDVVLAVAWIAPVQLRIGQKEVVQFRAKNKAMEGSPIVDAVR